MRRLLLLAVLARPLFATITFAEPGTDGTHDLTLYAGSHNGNINSSSDCTVSHTGPCSLKLVFNASGAFSYCPDGCAGNNGRLSYWFRFNQLPSANAATMSLIGSGTQVLIINYTAAGHLTLSPVGVTAVTGTTVLSANTWYRIGVSWTITNSTTFKFQMYINGNPEISVSSGTLTNATVLELRESLSASAGSGAIVWYDDIYADNVSDYSDTGNVFVTAKRPVSNGSSNQFTTQVGSGGSGYGTGHSPQVNEQPASSTNGWSISTTTVKTEEYTVEGASVGDLNITGHTILGVMGWIYTDVASTSNSPVQHIIVGGVSTAVTLTTSPKTFIGVTSSTSYPAGGTDIGMDSQFTTTATLASLFECGIVIAYSPALTGSATDSGLISEAPSNYVGRVKSATEPVLVSDSGTGRGAHFATPSEVVLSYDRGTGLGSHFAAPSEFVLVSDSRTALGVHFSSASELSLVRDSGTGLGAHYSSVSEVGLVSDSNSRLAAHNPSVAELVLLTDVGSRLATLSKSASEVGLVSDSRTGVGGHFGSASELSLVSDLGSRIGAHNPSASELGLVSDSRTGLGAHLASASELSLVSDLGSRVGAHSRSSLDVGLVSDLNSRLFGHAVFSSDALVFLDSATSRLGKGAMAVEGLLVADSLSRTVSLHVSGAEPVLVSEVTSRQGGLLARYSESLVVSDSPQRSGGFNASGKEPLFIVDGSVKTVGFHVVGAETIMIRDIENNGTPYFRSTSEVIGLAEKVTAVGAPWAPVVPAERMVLYQKPPTYWLYMSPPTYWKYLAPPTFVVVRP